MINKAEEFLSFCASSILMLLLIILVFDIMHFLQIPQDYISDFYPSKNIWQWDYLQNSVLFAGLTLLCLTLNIIAFYKKENTPLIILRGTINITLFIAIILNFYLG